MVYSLKGLFTARSHDLFSLSLRSGLHLAEARRSKTDTESEREWERGWVVVKWCLEETWIPNLSLLYINEVLLTVLHSTHWAQRRTNTLDKICLARVETKFECVPGIRFATPIRQPVKSFLRFFLARVISDARADLAFLFEGIEGSFARRDSSSSN